MAASILDKVLTAEWTGWDARDVCCLSAVRIYFPSNITYEDLRKMQDTQILSLLNAHTHAGTHMHMGWQSSSFITTALWQAD